MRTKKKDILVICGPNASGKTRLGVTLAGHLGGEVISADSRQLYRHMNIGTGKDLKEYETSQGRVPCHCIDVAEPQQVYTLFHYQRDCYRTIEEIRGRGNFPLMVGGTGLYIEAVLKHYAIPNVPEDAPLRRSLMKKPKEELARMLHEADAGLYERTDRCSRKRIVRALEVARYAREHPVEWGVPNPPHLNPLVLAVRWRREELRARIGMRLRSRLEEGMVQEVQDLVSRGLTRERLAMFGLEYKHIARLLGGEVGYEQMVGELETDICRFAKRQMTYFRGMERRGTPMVWIDRADADAALRVLEEHGMLDRA